MRELTYSGPTSKIVATRTGGRARGVYVTNKAPGPVADGGSCPGASEWCAPACYAVRPFRQYKQSRETWTANAASARDGAIPPAPANARYVRIHGSGDFETLAEIFAYIAHAKARPDVQWWAYTRSWRVNELLPALRTLQKLPNVQLFASMDPTIRERPPKGWRVAWIDTDDRAQGYACPEQNGRKIDCVDCGYCFRGTRRDVTFAIH